LPIYEYRCKNGHNFEVTQSMADDPVAVCQVCGAPVERVFHPVAVHFKGSGFYTTDYGRKRGGGASTDSDSGSDSGSKEDSKSDSTKSDSTKTDSSKSDSKDTTSSKSESSSSSSSDD
jgi:putative FmdB family regulatory protein